jgi:hypothetical protein
LFRVENAARLALRHFLFDSLRVIKFMKYFIASLLFFSTFANPIFAADLAINNAGFVPSNIWYSKDPFFAGEKIRIYTIIFNGSIYDLTGGVEFLDNGTPIGKTTFALANGGRVRDLWIDWKATAGKHIITAHLINVVADGPSGKQAVALPNSETGKSDRTVELDPVAKAAEMKLQEAKAAEMKKQAIGKVDDVLQSVNNTIPEPLKEGISLGTNVLEALRLSEADSLSVAREEKAQEIEAIKAREQTRLAGGSAKTVISATDAMLNTAEKPFAYVALAVLTLGQYIFEWQVVFYGIILYVLYRIIRWIVRKVRNKQ